MYTVTNMERTVMDAEEMERTLARMAHEILERHRGVADLALIGIKKRGDIVARRLAVLLGSLEKTPVPVGAVDITLYRDDLSHRLQPPSAAPSEIGFPVEGRRILLVDDVLFTGRTVRAALNEILDFGRPKQIQLAVLVDRGGRELPVQADYVGKRMTAGPGETVIVRLRETDGREEIAIAAKADA